jgi:hypothetical protein
MILIDLEKMDRFTGHKKYTLLVLTHVSKESKQARIFHQVKQDKARAQADLLGYMLRMATKHGMPYSPFPWWDVVYWSKVQVYQTPKKIVSGSLGIGFGNHIWWEHGDATWTTFSQFLCPNQGVDCYFWMEEDGLIYDVLRPYLLSAVLGMGYRLPNETFPIIVDGRTIEDLKADGFVYVPAPEMVQTLLLQKVKELNVDLLQQMGW